MGNWAHLDGCRSREAVVANGEMAAIVQQEPELAAKYRLPLFWLVAFGPRDTLAVRPRYSDGTQAEEDLLVLCAPAREAVERLERRRSSVLALLPPAFAGYYDEWVAFLRLRFGQHLLVRTDDLFGMIGWAEAGQRLEAALRELEPADQGRPLGRLAEIEWFCGVGAMFRERAAGQPPDDAAAGWREELTGHAYEDDGTPLWPAAARAEEIAFAAEVPEARPPAAPPASGLARWVAGGGELLVALSLGLGGLVFLLIGALMLWAAARPPWQWTSWGIALAVTAGGALALHGAVRAGQRLRTIGRS